MKKLSIHVVENEIIIALDLEDILEDLGHEVRMSYTIKDAMDHVVDSTSDLFLIDIQLHGNDTGIQLGKVLQQRNIPHIYISAYTDQETKDMAESTSSLGYLSKPFNEKEFKKMLEYASIVLAKKKD